MKRFLIPFLMGVALFAPRCASSQTASAPQGWARVQALPAGAKVHVKLRDRSLDCKVTVADADTLTCVRDAKSEVLQKADIKSIKIHHRLRSTLIGAGIGAGILAIIGAATTHSNTGAFDIFTRGEVALILAIPGAVLGAIAGALTDFTESTVYKA